MLRVLLTVLFLQPLALQAALLLEQPITLERPNGVLRGTLLLPISQSPVPVVLLHPGSGPTDRNGNQPQAQTNNLRQLARALADQGIASLRYDKRGVAASLAAEPDESQLTLNRYRDDLIAWSDKLAQDPRFAQQILLGHSEGALIVSLAAPATSAQALVLAAGSGQPIDQLLLKQLSVYLTPDLLTYSAHLIASVKAGDFSQPVPPELATLFRPSVQPYLHDLLQQDPRRAFASTLQPALIIQGSIDAQVSPYDAEQLASSRPGTQLALIEGMDHVLKMAPSNEPLANYNQPQVPLSKDFLNALFRFLEDQGILQTEVLANLADS